MDRASLVITVLMMVLTAASIWTYYRARVIGLADALAETLAENAKLRVAIDAAGKTEEARKVCAVTLAALNAAYPNAPHFASAVAEKVKEEEGE